MNICGRSRAVPEAGGLNKRGFMPVRVFSEEEKKEIKEKMFTQGMELIKEYGLTHTSVSKITERAGIGKSTFYNFFLQNSSRFLQKEIFPNFLMGESGIYPQTIPLPVLRPPFEISNNIRPQT